MGGTNTRVAGSEALDQITFVDEPLRRRNTQSYENDLDAIVSMIQKTAGRHAIQAVGIGTPGTPSADKLGIDTAVNIPHWNNRPLVRPIADALDCPVYYHNDAVTAGLGEAYYGNYTANDFHYLIWGTGVGGAAIERDNQGNVNYASKLIWKPRFREWNAECGGGNLGKHFNKSPENFTEAEWTSSIKRFSSYLLRYIDDFTPPAIVFGGGLAHKHRNELQSLSSKTGIDIVVSKFDNDSGIMGSFGLIRYEQNPNHKPYIHQDDPED